MKFDHYNIFPKTIMEIGIGEPHDCRIKEYFNTNVRCILVEPNPKLFSKLVSNFGNIKNVELINVAIGEYDGFVKLKEYGCSSFLENSLGPAVQFHIKDKSNEYLKKFNYVDVQCKKMDTIEKELKSNIDVLLLDMEGSEYYVIKNLISRPKFIAIEMEVANINNRIKDIYYINPFTKEIFDFMNNNNYLECGRSSGGGDTYFIQKLL